MDVIFEGALSRSWGMQDVLKAIMGVDNQPFGILRISSPSSRLSGRLAIADGAYIVGAVSADDLNPEDLDSGYQAVRKLLTAREGNFAFLDTAGQRPTDMDGSLYISIDRLVPLLPQLPDDPCQLFDEKSLLDKVFGPDGNLLSTASAPNMDTTAKMIADGSTYSSPTDTANRLRKQSEAEQRSTGDRWNNAADRDLPRATPPDPNAGRDQTRTFDGYAGEKNGQKVARNPNWQLFKPLISTTAITDPNGRLPTDAFDTAPIDETNGGKQSLSRLRENEPAEPEPWYQQLFRESLLSTTSLIWIGAILILSLVATLFVTAAVNQHNSLTIQKNDSQPTN